MEDLAFFGFLAPIIGGLFGSATAGALASAAVGIGGQLLAANQQKKAAQAERRAIAAAESSSQAAYRDSLRSGASGRGSGDFSERLGSSGRSLTPQLKTLTGQ